MTRAVAAQYDGRIDDARVLLRRALQCADADDRYYVAEFLVPILLMRNAIDEAAEVLDGVLPVGEVGRSGHKSMRALVEALRGDGEVALRLLAEAQAGASEALMAARVQQRAAFVKYALLDVQGTLDDATGSARRFVHLGAFRSAAASYSLAYNAYQTLTGDVESAYRMAERIAEYARRSRDRSFEAAGVVAMYGLAGELHDAKAVDRLRGRLLARPLPRQYGERFARFGTDALRLGWAGDFAGLRATAILMRKTLANTRPEVSLCLAFCAIAEVAVGQASAASRLARRAIAVSASAAHDETAYERRYRRLARGIAAAAGFLAGDVVRARRAISVKGLDGHDDIRVLLRVAEGMDADRAPRGVRGYAAVIEAARRLRAAAAESPFTLAERQVLELLACGWNAPQIAHQLGRSVHTVRAHTRAIVSKMRVSGRAAAVHAARVQHFIDT